MTPTQKILIVDDEADIRELIAISIASKNNSQYQLTEAADGVQALTQLDQQPFDLIITDLKMPNQGGTEMIHQIRTSSQKNKHTKVLILSGHITKHQTEHIENIYYLKKPFSPKRLNNFLKIILADSKAA